MILLSEYWRFTGQDAFVLGRWDKVAAALAWIDRYGDRDGDGYVEYQTRSREGLGNQCWKDSWDGVQFADGTIPYLPIATAEIQGYVYDAKLRVAELARRLRDDVSLSERLEREAEELYDRFNQDFWSEDRGGYYVVGLDGDKRRIDSLTSNIGHLLWSGIVPEERARRRRSAHVGRDVRAGASARCRPTIAATTRSATTPARSGRMTTQSSHSDSRAPVSATRRTGSHWRSWRRPPSRATGFRRRSRASSAGSAASLSRTHGLQPPGVGHCGPFRLRAGDAWFEARDGELRLDPACPKRSGRSAFAACMRSGRSGTSRRSAPKAMFAAPRASTLDRRRPCGRRCGANVVTTLQAGFPGYRDGLSFEASKPVRCGSPTLGRFDSGAARQPASRTPTSSAPARARARDRISRARPPTAARRSDKRLDTVQRYPLPIRTSARPPTRRVGHSTAMPHPTPASRWSWRRGPDRRAARQAEQLTGPGRDRSGSASSAARSSVSMSILSISISSSSRPRPPAARKPAPPRAGHRPGGATRRAPRAPSCGPPRGGRGRMTRVDQALDDRCDPDEPLVALVGDQHLAAALRSMSPVAGGSSLALYATVRSRWSCAICIVCAAA